MPQASTPRRKPPSSESSTHTIAARLILRAMHGEGKGQALPERDWGPPPPIGQLPPMAPVVGFSDTQRGLVNSLSSSTRIDRSVVVPSLYRHLVGWPGLIFPIHAEFAPRFESGEIERCVAATAGAMEAEAARLVVYMPALPNLAGQDQIADVLNSFSFLIPDMVVVGILLRRGLSDG